MATPVKSWSDGSISIAVESDKDTFNKEDPHVHVYKNGRRTDVRIQASRTEGRDLDDKDIRTAEALFDRYYHEIEDVYNKVMKGVY